MATTTEFVGLKLVDLLNRLNADDDLKTALPGLFQECCGISRALRTTKVTSAGTSNTFGDKQLSVDLLAEQKLRDWAKSCKVVRAISSEESTDLVEVHPSGSLILCWDPLDGSSIVDCNFSVASIFGIWQLGKNGIEWKGAHSLINATGRQQVASLLVIYGPRTTALLGVGGRTFDFQLDTEGGEHVIVRAPCCISKCGAKIFAPANLRAAQDVPAYNKLVQEWMKKKYTLRYTGGLGPDVYQLFIKGQGVFCNPTSKESPPKLRLLYEAAPIAFLVEAAGGRTTNGSGSVLDVVATSMNTKTSICCGSEEEVVYYESLNI